MTKRLNKPRSNRATILRARQLRQETTPAERELRQQVRNHWLNNLQIRRQHPIGQFVVDFCCEPAKVVIELDGPPHLEPEQSTFDRDRSEWLAEHGYRVIRFTNDEVSTNLTPILRQISEMCMRVG
jgi:5-methyltetrahydrofolate--homocysteine methyltransferase